MYLFIKDNAILFCHLIVMLAYDASLSHGPPLGQRTLAAVVCGIFQPFVAAVHFDTEPGESVAIAVWRENERNTKQAKHSIHAGTKQVVKEQLDWNKKTRHEYVLKRSKSTYSRYIVQNFKQKKIAIVGQMKKYIRRVHMHSRLRQQFAFEFLHSVHSPQPE